MVCNWQQIAVHYMQVSDINYTITEDAHHRKNSTLKMTRNHAGVKTRGERIQIQCSEKCTFAKLFEVDDFSTQVKHWFAFLYVKARGVIYNNACFRPAVLFLSVKCLSVCINKQSRGSDLLCYRLHYTLTVSKCVECTWGLFLWLCNNIQPSSICEAGARSSLCLAVVTRLLISPVFSFL